MTDRTRYYSMSHDELRAELPRHSPEHTEYKVISEALSMRRAEESSRSNRILIWLTILILAVTLFGVVLTWHFGLKTAGSATEPPSPTRH